MEVLIAMFVMSVGLLGLAALIPLGRWQIEEAKRIDRGAALGRAAFRDMVSRNYLDLDNWVYCTPTFGERSVFDNGSNQFRLPPASDTSLRASMRPPNAPLVFDPLMVAANAGDSSTLAAVSTFPYELPGTPTALVEWSGAPRLARTTLLDVRFGLGGSGGGSGGSSTPNWLMTLASADRYFRAEDDLEFSEPRETGNRKPGRLFSLIQVKGNSGSPYSSLGNGQSKGDFTWFAVVAPSRLEALGSVGALSSSSLYGPRQTTQYSVTVVVCHKRNLQSLQDVTYENRSQELRMRGERRAYFEFLSRADPSMGSSEAWMTMSGMQSKGEAEEATNLKGGEWVMITARVPTPDTSGDLITHAEWFRVLSVGRGVEPAPNGENAYRRRVRLTSNTWCFPAASSSGGGGGTLAPGYAVIVHGVCGVYRKTLMADHSGAWTD